MRTFYHVLTRNSQDAEELFAYLKAHNYAYGGSFKNWDNPDFSDINIEHNCLFGLNTEKGNLEPIPWNKIMAADLESTMNQAISVYDTKLMVDTLEPIKEPVELNQEPRKSQAELKEDMEHEVDKPPEYHQKSKFAKISERQIIARFESKNNLDSRGNPLKLCKIVLPSPELSESPIMADGKPIKYATIVVPEFTIIDDKFSKEPDRKVVSLRPDYQYVVYYPGTEKDEKGFAVQKMVKVSGMQIYEAFKFKGREKSLDDRINEAKEQRGNTAHEEKEMDISKTR